MIVYRTSETEADSSVELHRLAAWEALLGDHPACEIDGRMLPHEWLEINGTFVKTDAIEHHDDHFFPGCQDIAWDLAGACIEFKLAGEQRDYLVGRYSEISRDRTIRRRMPFCLAAYAAFRLGYVSLAADTLDNTPDAVRFRRLRRQYSCQLRKALLELDMGRTDS